MMKIKILTYTLFIVLNGANCLAQTLFTENMGSPSASPTSIAANTFQNKTTLTYSNGAQATSADIRTTNVSSGYTGASGGGNVYFTTTSGAYGFSIEGINATSYATLGLQFGYRKESATSHATFSVDYWNGSSWITVANTATTLFNEAANATSAWYLSKMLSLPSGALINGLKIRFVKTGAVAVRIDDVRLVDTMFAQVAPICSGTTLSPLPTTTSSGITGIWSPVLDNTVTTNYTFTPDQGQNARNTNMTIVVNPLPTATISGTTSTCINFPASIITFTGLNGTSNYKFTYKINNGSPLTITSAVGTATATLTVPTSTARTDVYTLLSVEDVNTTCSQSQTGIATVTIDVCTALTASLRGITLGDLNSVLSVSAVTGATTYRYEVTNLSTNVVSIFERTDSNKTLLSLDQLQAAPALPIQTITYGTTYSIRAAVNNGNYVFGPAYTVTTPLNVPKTKLAIKYCGPRITALNEPVYANIIYNASKYKFKVNGGGIVNEEIVSNSYGLVLTSLTQAPILYDTEYSVQVKVSVDGGVTYPTDYGSACSVFTPLTIPKTRIVEPNCGTTLASSSAVMYAVSVYGANLYKYEVTGGTIGTRIYTTPNASLRLTYLDGGAENSTSYSIKVAVSLDNGLTWEQYGVSCTIATPAVVPSVPLISSISSTSLDITIGNDLNSLETTYAILETSTGKYVQSNGTLGVTAVYQNKATWGTKTIINLTPLTTYIFKVTAQNSIGTTTLAGPTASGATLVGTTKIMQNMCGNTLTSINSTIYADAITEATLYRFEVTNGTIIREYETSNRYFTLNQLSGGGAYNTTYSIKVAIYNGTWQPYGVSCNVTTPIISPTMMACGSSLVNLYSTIAAFDTPLSTMYRFKIKKQGSTETTILDSPIRTFNLSQLTVSDPTGIAAYNTTYSVSVAVKIEDVWSNDSPSCDYTTPSPGTTMMGCGSTLANLYSTIAAFDAPLASTYRFTIKNTTTNGISILETSTRDFNLSQLTTSIGSAGIAAYKTTYAIAVAVKIADTWTNDSPFCNFSTPTGTTIMPASCGITLASLNTVIYANAAPLASGYRFEVTNGSVVRTYDSPASERFFSLDKLQGGGAYNTTYTVRVAVLINGIPTDYSPSCNIISPTNCSGTLNSPTAISGNISPYSTTSNLVYSIPLVNFASNYTWSVPTGWTITSGLGTNSIVVTSGAINQNGIISVIAGDGCRISNAQSLAVSVNTLYIPSIITTGTLPVLSTNYGTASSFTSFSFTGSYLTEKVVITAPSGYEISMTSGEASDYANSKEITPTAGVIVSTTVYVRLAATTSFGIYSGNITLESPNDGLLISLATAPSSVSKLDVTITGVTVSNKVYDGTIAANLNGTAVLNGVLPIDTNTVLLNTLGATATFTDASIGVGKSVNVTGYTLSGSASANYNLIQPSGLNANITANGSSDIIFNNSSTTSDNTNINYRIYQGITLTSTQSGANGSLGVMGFYLRDGGAGLNDADNLGTELTSVNFNVVNPNNILRMARLFIGTSARGIPVAVPEPINGISTIVFTNLTNIIAADNNQLAVNLRVTFKNTVVDNEQLKFTVVAATAGLQGSQFAASNGGAATSSIVGDINRIEVTADRLSFVQEPSNSFVETNMNPSPSIEAIDSNNNRDFDFSNEITMNSSGTLNSQQTVNAINGLSTFNNINHTVAGNGLILTASATALTSTNSNTFTINPLIIPNFIPIEPICYGGTLNILPTTSTNGIFGTWSPPLNNLTTTQYTFTPTSGQNATSTVLTIIVNAIPSTPVAIITQPSCTSNVGSVILSNLPTNGIWSLFKNETQILNNIIQSSYSDENLSSGTYSYYISNGNCKSNSISVNIIQVATWKGTSGIDGHWDPIISTTNTSPLSLTISGTYDTTISGNLNAISLVLNSGAVLNINYNNSVSVQNCIVNDGTINITDNGSITCNNNN